MSATRVINPVLRSNIPCSRQLNRIKRDLFGPANPIETTKIFQEELEKQHEKATKKWGFDFRAGLPLQSNALYSWERVSFPESSYTPEMYTLTRAAHMRPILPEPTSLDLLMDERSERENFVANISASSATETDSCDDSQDELMPVAFNLPAALVGHGGDASTATKRRQPKITEYMKERKRLSQAPKKLSGNSPPAKRMRTSSSSSGNSGSHGTAHFLHQQHSISMHFLVQRNRNQQPN